MSNPFDPDALEKANHAFESAWNSVFELVEESHMDQQIQLAARRLLSYNPQHHGVEKKFPELYSAVNSLCTIITSKIEELAKKETVENWTILLYCYLMMNDMPNAYTAIAHALRLQSNINDPYFNYSAGIVNQHFRYYENAIKFLQKPPDNFEQNIDRNFRLAIAFRSIQNYAPSEVLFRNLLKRPPPNLTINDIKIQLAYTLQLAQKNEEAAKIYEELFSQFPQCLELRQQYVWFLSLQNDPRSLARANELIGDSTDSLLTFASARIAVKQNDVNTAYERYKECTTAFGESSLFWFGLGVLYLKNEQYKDAIVAFQHALYQNSDLPEAWLNLGLIYEILKEDQNASKIYQTALSNCDSKIVTKRLNEIRQPQRQSTLSENFADEIIEIDGNRLFTQPIERISNLLVSHPPFLNESCLNSDNTIQLSPLIPPYTSLFQ